MAGRKNQKTSKTDHVLNLLSSGRPAESAPAPAAPAAEPSPPPREEPPAAQPPAAGRAPILEVARSNHAAIASAIHDALEEALQAELAAESPAEPPAAPREESAPADGEPPAELPAERQAGPGAAPEEAPAAPSPPPAADGLPSEGGRGIQAEPLPPPTRETASPEPEEPQAAAEEDGALPDGTVLLNVMEALVDDKLPRYVKMFHLCACPRCLADAKALALSRLPAKYLVLPRSAAAPMLGLYRAKWDFDLTTQVVYACKTVMEHPRHDPALAAGRGEGE